MLCGTEPMRGKVNGLWRLPHVPHCGWTCVDIEDLGCGNTIRCEMCRAKHVRYVHLMAHPDYPFDGLRAGCVCAERMALPTPGGRAPP
jgi:hypothetical protein